MSHRTRQLRTPSKRRLAIAGGLVVLSAALIWGLERSGLHAGNLEGAPAYSQPMARTAPDAITNGSVRNVNATNPPASSPIWSDENHDGIPDFAELHTFEDRDSFRRWFTAIAESQFYQLSDAWNPEQRDCAGLVRFAMREALRRHDRLWFQRMGPGFESVAPDVAGIDIDHNPLEEKIFRTDFGTARQTDLSDGKFSEFADGQTLKNFNTNFVSRDRRQARPGDLVFFYQPWVQKSPYHAMVFLGAARFGQDQTDHGAADWVVYHTGSSPKDQGTVKKVRLAVLEHHPDPRWRPVESNPNFLGFYRLKILE